MMSVPEMVELEVALRDDIEQRDARILALESALAKADKALEPFANFAPSQGFENAFPNDVAITPGSRLSKRQLTFGDLRNASAMRAEIAKLMEGE